MNRVPSQSMGDEVVSAEPCTSLEVALGVCSRAEEDALRSQATEDPALLFALAEDVAFFEQCRELRVEPSARYGAMLRAVVRRAEKRVPKPVPILHRPWVILCAAAAVTFLVLLVTRPLARRAPSNVDGVQVRIATGWPRDQAAGLGGGHKPSMMAVASEDHGAGYGSATDPDAIAVSVMRERFVQEDSDALRAALADAVAATGDPLARWLDPRNTVALMRLDYEVRGFSDVRERALRSQGALVDADRRVQMFADELAQEMTRRLAAVPFEPEPSVREMAMVVRALLAAGPTSVQRTSAMDQGALWLAERLPNMGTSHAVTALVALVEVAAVTGRHGEVVRDQGRRLLNDVLLSRNMTWQRRRPELLAPQMAVATVGDAMRVLRYLPAYGIDAEHCDFVRNLLIGSVRERMQRGDDGPECLAALVYGGADLLPEADRYDYERRLRRWQPVSLAPDFVTLQQWAWGMEPGRSGYTHLQWNLRPLAALARPTDLFECGALTLCLAMPYAAPRGGFLQGVARACNGS